MEEEHFEAVEVDGERRREAPHELTVLVREELRPPLAGVDELLPDLVLRLGHSLEKAGVPVAHHVQTAELADAGQRLGRLRADGDVAETDDLVEILFLELGNDRVEREAVAVDVRDETDAQGDTSGSSVEAADED